MSNTDALVWVLKTEHERKDRSGLYGYTQRTMAYNSNHIEGSTLTEDQTALLFEEGYLPATDDIYKTKDVEEMTGHFMMFNRMMSYIGQPLTEEMIKGFHYELKAGVFEDRANGYAIGDYKKRSNTVGNLEMAAPAEVQEKMAELLEWYHGQPRVTLSTLALFHAKYELIHPFQDGNGRTGRMILFRECIEKGIMPFIIHSENRPVYISSLRTAQMDGAEEKLAQFFEKEQGHYAECCENFDVYNRYQHYLSSQTKIKAEGMEIHTLKHRGENL